MAAPQLAPHLIHHRLVASRRRARRADQLIGDAAERSANDHQRAPIRMRLLDEPCHLAQPRYLAD